MGTTALNQIPYPEPTETPYVHLDMKAQAEAVDARLSVTCTSTTRPAHRAGRFIFETNTGCVYVSTGSAWIYVSGSPFVQDVGAGGGSLGLESTSGTDPATITIPMAGVWEVNGESLFTLSPPSPVLLVSILSVNNVQSGGHFYSSGPVAGELADSHTLSYTRVVTFTGGEVLTTKTRTSAAGGTQTFGGQMLTAHRIG